MKIISAGSAEEKFGIPPDFLNGEDKGVPDNFIRIPETISKSGKESIYANTCSSLTVHNSDNPEISEITILPGINRDGCRENFNSITIRPGDTISVVGPTGSGKSALINDIEIFARKDTVTGRTVLINGEDPPDEYIRDPAKKPVALITQNTKCLADLIVRDFLQMHLLSRKMTGDSIIQDTISLANEFTGEKIIPDVKMTSLSGGQTRSLMVADAIIISNAPIVLLDEVENAGIFKEKVIEALKKHQKSLIFVTHDPLVSLLSDRRIVMKNGAVDKILIPGEEERDALREIIRMDGIFCRMREKIRAGELITSAGVI
ncbi:ATP-binding cassette domain-containing protein [Methanoplanus endosymbiosus]|uniref:ATP-binding cassette domain-containing protein n=1 Tax=Methanoplanus endosymbiosus TaxID=33865 RepID=A0A9E7TLL1_9EURY|nr:ATP-binding cassette domain-containing protein [Methanoplanus endosymbiosus]UUX92476.1 ATP-binding cassette domain-containing protein [Methanoplanus endosymbiosus]